MPARTDLDTMLAMLRFLVTMPAASPYLVQLAFSIASSTVLKKKKSSDHKSSFQNVFFLFVLEMRSSKLVRFLSTDLNFMRDITGPKISSCAIVISSCMEDQPR